MIGGDKGINYICTTSVRLDSISYEWSKAGDLIKGRKGHNAIFDGSNIIVVGGYGTFLKTEYCKITGSMVTCVELDPSLIYYAYYSELFLVEEHFCKEMPSL